MITTTFIIATVAYIVFNFAFAFVWNLGIFKKQYETLTGETAREKPIIPLGFLAIVIQALALSTLFALFYSGTNPITGGLFLERYRLQRATCRCVFVSPEGTGGKADLGFWIKLALAFNKRAKPSKKRK